VRPPTADSAPRNDTRRNGHASKGEGLLTTHVHSCVHVHRRIARQYAAAGVSLPRKTPFLNVFGQSG
jgi:hypothetical protein